MPSDKEMLARLNRTVERSHPSEWTREAFPGDLAAIRWAVERIGELDGALVDIEEETNVWLHEELKDATETICAIGQIVTAALSPAPAKGTGTRKYACNNAMCQLIGFHTPECKAAVAPAQETEAPR